MKVHQVGVADVWAITARREPPWPALRARAEVG